MADLGLLSGIAAGLGGFREGYDTERKYQDKKEQEAIEAALKKKMFAAQLAGQELVEEPTGAFTKTPEARKNAAFERATKESGLLKSGHKIGEYDPENDRYGLVKDPNFRDYEEENKRLTNEKLRKELNRKDEGKIIPAGEAVSTGGSTSATEALSDVLKLVNANKNSFGPISGRIGSAMASVGANSDAAGIKATLKQRAQIIGKYLEGGKLTDSDIERYVESLPGLSDSPELAESKIASLTRLIEQKQKAELAALQGAGYDTSSVPRIASDTALPGLLHKKTINKRQTPGTEIVRPVQADEPPDPKEFTPDVVQYANKHGITLDQALRVKKQRGG